MIWIRTVTVLLIVLVLQLELFSELRIGGVAAQALLVAAVCGGLTGGPERGAVFGFVAGALIDLYIDTPFGLSAAAYALAAGLIGFAQDAVMERSLLTNVGFPALGTGIGLVAFISGGVALGESTVFGPDTGRIIVTVVLLNAFLGLLLVPITRWMWDLEWDRGPTTRAV